MADSQRSSYSYRPMTVDDVDAAHQLSVQLKWPHRREDWAMLQRVSQGFVAEDKGRVIGSAFTCHQGGFSTIGLVIVSDEYQGKGIGRQLMNLAIEAATPRTAILNATLAGAPLYASLGFVDFGSVEQRQGQAPAEAPPAPSLAFSESCRSVSEADYPRLFELANAGSGLDRTQVLKDLLPSVEHSAAIERNGQLQAFALLRPFGRGLCIGPVIAQNMEQAKYLISQLLSRVPYSFVRIDIPTDSGLADWLDHAGLKAVDSVTQMAKGEAPQATAGVAQFALVTQAVG
ncbi:GNAT family N-acetyltransferase [Pseudomonas sp. Irchel 3A5]|uniref:GNAT family N-acetyltransferase n=1 Tax=Pseudomonas sp. Irchel 3A5 TaxID=2008911 RepID=UPI000BA3F9E1|nr:GNAT family N-acetyltransferase [Pseudomonas sp. Irchel 3A5]